MIQVSRRAPIPIATRMGSIDFGNLPFAVVTVIMLVLVGTPLMTAAITSPRPGDTLPFEPGAWTLANYGQVLSSPQAAQLLRNTVIYTLTSLAVALPIAFALAW